MDTQKILQKVNEKYYGGSSAEATNPSFVAEKSQEVPENLTSKVVNQIQKDPTVKKDLLSVLEQKSSKIMKPVSDFFFGATGRTIGGLLSAGYGNLLEFSKDEQTKERGKKIRKKGEEQFTPTNIGFTALELIPGGGALKQTVKEGFEKVGFKAGEKAIDYGSELLSKAGGKIKTGVKNTVLNIGSRLTSVSKDVLERWGNYAAKTPEKLEKVKEYVAKNADNPMTALVDNVSEGVKNLKNKAQEAFTSAKEVIKQKYAGTTFNLNTSLKDVNQTLSKFNLEGNVTRDASGKFTSAITISPKTRTSPFTAQEIKDIENVVSKIGIKDMTTDEMLDFVDLAKSLKEKAILSAEKTGNKKIVPLTMNLFDDATRFVEKALPEITDANQMYREYYKIMDKFGNKIIDSQGNIKQGAESFLSNALNLNKGEQRRQIEEASKKLGIDVLGNVEMLKDATKMMQNIPNSVRNRMVDMLIAGGLTAAGTGLGAKAGGAEGAGYGAATGLAGAGILYAMSNPSRYGKIIEWLAKKEVSEAPVGAIRQLYQDMGIRLSPRVIEQGVKAGQNEEMPENYFEETEPNQDEWSIGF